MHIAGDETKMINNYSLKLNAITQIIEGIRSTKRTDEKTNRVNVYPPDKINYSNNWTITFNKVTDYLIFFLSVGFVSLCSCFWSFSPMIALLLCLVNIL